MDASRVPLLDGVPEAGAHFTEQDLRSMEEALFAEGFNSRVIRPFPHLINFDLDFRSLFRETGRSPEHPDSTEDAKLERAQWGRLLKLAVPEMKWIGGGLLALTLRLPFNLAMPHFISVATADTVAASAKDDWSNLGRIQWAVGAFLVCGVMNSFLDYFNWILFVRAQQGVVRRMRCDLLQAITAQEIAFFDSVSTGDLISRLTSDVGEMSNDLTWVFRQSLEAVIRVGGISIYLFWVSWQLALVVWAVVPLIAAVNHVYRNFLHKNAVKVQASLARANEVAHEAIGGVRTVYSCANEQYECTRYRTHIQKYFDLSMRQGQMDGLYFMGISSFLMQTLLQGTVLGYGIRLVFSGCLRPSALLACMFYQSQMMEYVNNMLNTFSNLYKSTGAAAKVFELLDRTPKRHSCRAGVAPPVVPAAVPGSGKRGHVELRAVHFAYPTRPSVPILQGLSLEVQPCRTLALVGTSGSGKSTIFHLLKNFYEPARGAVLLDGVEVKLVEHRYLQRMVGAVGQEPVLFKRSIRENIAYSVLPRAEEGEAPELGEDGSPLLTPERVVNAAKIANIHEFVSSLPDDYDTEVGERGVQLSGGQKQRIAIARAVMGDPAVLLLDEATSALDSESERIVQAALERAMVGRSVLVIAHRLSTVLNADCIMVLDHGEVVEIGTHDELIAKPLRTDGRNSYRKLAERQAAFNDGGGI